MLSLALKLYCFMEESAKKTRYVARWQVVLLLVTLVTYVLKTISRSYPELVQRCYTDGLYDGIRWLFDVGTGWIPFAFIYIVIAVLVLSVGKNVVRWIKLDSWKTKGISALVGILVLLGIAYTSFTWFWGFNYEKTAFSQRHELSPLSIPDSVLFADLEILASELALLRETIELPDSITWDHLPEDLDKKVRSSLNDGLIDMGYAPKGKLRAKLLYPKGSLLRISTAGVFLPFSGEGHVDPGLHPIMIPFVMAHEMSHAQGFTDEGVCNFVAHHTMSQSSDRYLSYCGQMGYFRYLASQCRRMDGEWYKQFFEKLDTRVRRDLVHISAYSRRYPDILPKFRDLAYDSYLKAQGIQEGMRSYNTVVRLKYQWEERYGN